MRIKCEINGQVCDLPDFLTDLFSNSLLVYCSTITKSGSPHVQPTIFINESNRCSIAFLANSQSLIVKNLYQNKKTSLTLDKMHPINPFLNRGIMVEALSYIIDSKDAIEESLIDLERKYTSGIISKILGIDIINQCVKIRSLPQKIVYWRNPIFRRFTCKKRKLIKA